MCITKFLKEFREDSYQVSKRQILLGNYPLNLQKKNLTLSRGKIK